jgi:hypothetical protein
MNKMDKEETVFAVGIIIIVLMAIMIPFGLSSQSKSDRYVQYIEAAKHGPIILCEDDINIMKGMHDEDWNIASTRIITDKCIEYTYTPNHELQ